MDYPNQGTIWHNTEKRTPNSPDFSGSMMFERDYLEQLISESKNGEVEIKLDMWKGKVNTKNGERHVLRSKVNTWKPENKPAADSGKDPLDE